MATQPQHPAHNPAAPPPKVSDDGPAPAPVAPAPFPGGMASDPAAAMANEIMVNLRGMPDRFRSHIDNVPSLKAVSAQFENDTMLNIAQSIRNLINAEVAKATGGLAPNPDRVAADRAIEREKAAERRTT